MTAKEKANEVKKTEISTETIMTQNRSIEYFNGVKSGRIKLNLGESWENREQLGLNEL